MANLCEFDMKVAGKRENINELISLLRYEGVGEIKGLGRIYEAFVTDEWDENGLSYAGVSGDCAWSIRSALIEIGKDRNLVTETRRLELVLEAYSREPGFCFSEHYLISKGEVLCEECVEYTEYLVEELTKEELNKLASEVNEDIDTIREAAAENGGYIGTGGFGEDYANFEDLSKYFSDETEMQSSTSKVEIFYKLRKHFIMEDISSRYPESDAIQSLDDEKLDLLAGKVLASLGKNDSYFEIYWNTIENVVKEEGRIMAN